MIPLHIWGVIICYFLEYGILFSNSFEGGSVARASAANVSIIRLTHNIWMGVKGDLFNMTELSIAIKIATILTVSWNCKNFLMQSKILRPYLTAVMMELKLSSKRMIPAAYLATYVPAIPIAKPISAFFKAGASLVPSPVMATTLLSCFSPVASRYLSCGDDLASTRSSLTIRSNLSIFSTMSFICGFFSPLVCPFYSSLLPWYYSSF